MANIVLHGVSLSPFVRKTRVYLEEKGLDYEQAPAAPGQLPPELAGHSPLGKIPFACIGGQWLADSSVICAYLERLHPTPAMYPADDFAYARTLWFEEYIDGGACEKLVFTVFFERIVAPLFLDQPTKERRVRAAIEQWQPRIYDYLNTEIGDRISIVGQELTLADIAIGSFFVNMLHARAMPARETWPNLCRYIDALHARTPFVKTIEEETAMLSAAARR